ncbi:hypothetical protein SSX86_022230 [Deinandra increscens subsp. villosa]|uniref:F-box domain-containing protein n=1 Tax=Deinandra increscens subsp. villosa TaxID=3103831 RepID=A0AAP0CNN1_9ASTR
MIFGRSGGCGGCFNFLTKKIVDSSALAAVVSIDDLLIEILLKLPTSSLRVFKSVSKRWLALITDPNFIIRRRQIPLIDPPSGLMFIKKHALSISSYECAFKFVSLDTKRIPSPTATFNLQVGSQKVEIFQSCNGLFLCRDRNYQSVVCNPSTHRYKTIGDPPCSNMPGFHPIGVRMAFDPSKSPHYKILMAPHHHHHRPDHLQAQIEIYSSETCNWSVCGDLLRYDHLQGFCRGIYWNGGIHWLEYRLDVEHPHITVTPTPPTVVGGVQKLFESSGCLFLLCTPVGLEVQLHIYEMCKQRLVWVERYVVDIGDVMMKYRKTWMLKKHHPRRRTTCELEWLCSGWIHTSVQCVVIEKKEEDSFLVMEIFGKIIQYKIVSKTIHKLMNNGTNGTTQIASTSLHLLLMCDI